MININFDDLISFIYNLFIPAVRVLSFFSTAPLFSSKLIGRKLKLIMAFSISWIIASLLPTIDIMFFSLDGLLIIISQILIGISLGFTMQLIFISIFMAGEIVSLQTGLSFSSLFDISSYSNMSILSRLLYVFLLLFFLEYDGHVWMISILFNTFTTMPIQKITFSSNIFLSIVQYSRYIFFDSIMLLFPIIAIQLVLNLSMGILNRFASQISLFSINFTVTLLVGIITLYLFIPTCPSFFIIMFDRLKIFILLLFK